MSLPTILEVALGLVVVYYILGAIVSFITRLITQTLETRATALEVYLKEALGDKYLELSALPQISAHQPIGHKGWMGVISATPMKRKLDRIPAPLLVDALFDISGLTGQQNLSAADLICIVEKLPESGARQAMLQWIQQGVTDLNELRNRTRDYLNGLLDQAASTFRVYARSSVILLAILITLAFGTDTIQLTRDLWNSSELRLLAQAQANQVVESQGVDANIGNLLTDLSAYSFRWGWWDPMNLPQALSPVQLAGFVVVKIIGLGLTAIAVSQGSSFWYDVLKKMTSHNGDPEDAREAESG